MPNIRVPEGDRKRSVSIRLPEWMIEQIVEKGTKQEVIEGILSKHFKKRENRPKQ